MTIKIVNNQLFEITYIEDIIKKNIPHTKIISDSLFGLITVQQGDLTVEIQCQVDTTFKKENAHDPFLPHHNVTFLDAPVNDGENITGTIEISIEIKKSFWIRFVIAAAFIVPFNVLYLEQTEVSGGIKALFYILAFTLSSIPEERKRQKNTKNKSELQQLLINLINEHNLTSSPEEKTDDVDDNKYDLLGEG